jgi:hypothetical protein
MLYNQSSNFLEACEDYVICLEAVKKLESMNNPDKKEEIIDLKQAMDELGAEILSKI